MTEYLTFFSAHIGNLASRLNTDKEVHSFGRHIDILVENVNSVEFIDIIFIQLNSVNIVHKHFSGLNSDNIVHSFGRLINILAENINSVE